jgi:signal transduction histidine kinase/DNA-binding response OmpR family regulator
MGKIPNKCSGERRILVVEDDESLNRLLQSVLERAGYFVDRALTGNKAIEVIEQNDYCLLLLDYELSDMNADELIDMLKTRGVSIPFIIVTGQGNESIAVRMMKLGARDYLVKEGDYLDLLPHIIQSHINELELENKYLNSQQQLKESEDKYRSLVEQLLSIYESITEPIFVTDLDTCEIIFSNSAFKEHFGPLKKVSCFKHIHQNDQPCEFCPVPYLQQQNIQAYYWEYQNQINKRWYRCLDKIIQWPDGKNVHFQLAFDISGIKLTEKELIKAKEQAEESDRLKTTFLANMSHEIRTPMNAIIGFTNILLTQEFDRERQNEFLTIVQQRSNDLLQIINDILDISRIEVGQMEIIETAGSLADMFQEIRQFYETKEYLLENKKPIQFQTKFSLPSKHSNVITDFVRVKQIIQNLLDNAFKFTSSGVVEFGCDLNNKKEILIYIKDTGIGITPEQMPIIFNHFIQGDANLTRRTGGAGLGLSISKGLVEIMQGKIWLESVVNQGSTFYFTIPFKPVNQLNEVTDLEVITYDWKGKTILVVEDDFYNSTLITEFLDKTGVHCLYAKKGSEAMELFYKEANIDLILMDIRLPDASGLELTKLMKASKPGCIVIAQTAYAFDNDKELCINHGCNDYITKPLNKAKLLQMIDEYLKQVKKAVPVRQD